MQRKEYTFSKKYGILSIKIYGKERKEMNRFKAVIFDMDGVIFDSERLYLQCCMEAGEKFGMENVEETCLSCIGRNTEKTLAIFSKRYGEKVSIDEFWLDATGRFSEKAQGGLLPVKKGARELLVFLKNKNVPVALASSTKYEKVHNELTAADLIQYFDVIVGGDMVTKSKPEPDIFLHAADLLGFAAKDCMIIEDSFNGVKAASASGAFVIMVPDLVQPTDEISKLTNSILPSLIDVKEYFIDKNCLIVEAARRKLIDVLKYEKQHKKSSGIYHKIQIDMTYNSNHMEGSKLTHDETRYIFETNTIGIENKVINIDDITETINHFQCIDYIIDHIHKPITHQLLKQLHALLKNNTSDSREEWFAVGEYKKLPNEVETIIPASPEETPDKMEKLISAYCAKEQHTFEEILDFHVSFERIHPFQDGNGRVGRLILLKECLANDIVPFIFTVDVNYYYFIGIANWGKENGYLTDTCLSCQDKFKEVIKYFRIDD